MKDISGRINKAENQMSVGRHIKPNLPPFILIFSESETITESRESLGPVDTWITYIEQLQAGQRANAERLKENPYSLPKIIVIELDADKEVQAREQLKATKNNQTTKNGGQNE